MRLLRVAGIALLAVLVGRLALPWIAMAAVDHLLGQRGLECSYERLDLGLLRGRVDLWHLAVREVAAKGLPPPPALLHVEHAAVDLSVRDLLRGDVSLRRIGIEGVDVRLDVSEAGLAALQSHAGSGSASPPPKTGGDEREPVNLGLPLELSTLRLEHARIQLVDATSTPPLDARLEANLVVSNLGAAGVPAVAEFTMTSPTLLDVLRVSARASTEPRRLDAQVRVEIAAFRPSALEAQLRRFGLAPVAQEISFAANVQVEGRVPDAEPGTATWNASLRDVRGTEDLREFFGLDELALRARTAAADAVIVEQLAVEGVRLRATRSKEQRLRCAGFELVPRTEAGAGSAQSGSRLTANAVASSAANTPAGTAASTAASSTTNASATAAANATTDAPATAAANTPPFWLEKLAARGVSLSFEDEGVEPAANLALEIELATVEGFGNDPLRELEPARLGAVLHFPGVAGLVRVDGTLRAFAPERSVSMQVAVEGIEPTQLEGYLRPLGWTSELRQGSAKLKLDAAAREDEKGVLHASAELSQIAFADRGGADGGAREFFSLGSLAADGLDLDPARAAFHVAEVRFTALEAAASRDAEGALHVFGLRSAPATTLARSAPAAAQPSAPAAAQPSAPAGPLALPRIEIDRLTGQDARLTFRDVQAGAALAFSARASRFGLEDLGLGGDASNDPSTARLHAELDVEPLAGRVSLEGSLRASPAPLAVELQLGVRGERIDLRALAPYGAALGVSPTLQHGELAFDVAAAARDDGGTWIVDSSVSNVRLSEDGAELAALEKLAVRGLALDPKALRLEAIEIDRPSLAASRDANGAFHVAGLRYEPPPGTSAKAPPVASSPAAPSAEPPPSFALGALRMKGATLGWRDETFAPPLASALIADFELGPGSIGVAGPPLAFRASLASPGNLDATSFSGQLTLPPSEISVDALLEVTGLRGGELARYLPEGISVRLQSGEAKARFQASIAAADGGGNRISASVREVVLRDAGAARSELEVGAFVFRATRIDPVAGVFLVDELSLAGVALDARRTSAGGLEALGLSIAKPASSASSTPPRAAAPPVTAVPAVAHAAVLPVTAVPAVASVANPPVAASSAARARPASPPLVRVEKLDLDCGRVTIASEDAASPPLVLHARLRSLEPLLVCDREPEQVPPLKLLLEGGLEPLVRELHAELQFEVFERAPRFDAELAVRGIDASSLARAAPELAALLDEHAMRDGQLTARVGASLRLERSNPAEFDFSRDFGAEFALEDVRLREGADGEPVAGLDALRIDVKRFSPATGDLHIAEIEIERPSAVVTRRADGIHAFGLVIREPRPATAPLASSSAPVAVAAAPAVAAPFTGPEIRIDSLLVREIDVTVRDESAEPAMVLPIDQLYAQVQRFTTRAFVEPLPVRFTVSVGTKATAMPARHDEVLAAFDEVSVSGQLFFAPALKGWTKVDLAALDLRNFAGPASQQGVDLGDGYLDAGIRLRLPGDGTVSVSSDFTFSELSLSEPAGGPISRVLQLPAPLDVVLFALKNASEEHYVPVSFQVDPSNVSTAAMLGAAVKSVGVVIATAVASAPLRVVGSVTDLFGITGGEEDPLAKRAVTLDFAPGAVELTKEQKASLARLSSALDDDEIVLVAQHALGSGDIAYAGRAANPGPEACRELVAGARMRRAELQRLRDECAADARVLYAVGREADARLAAERLRALSRELASTEEALDGVLELLRPNAERRSAKRTRLASLALAQARLDALRAFFASTGVESPEERIELRKPTFVLPAQGSAPTPGQILVVPRLRKSGG